MEDQRWRGILDLPGKLRFRQAPVQRHHQRADPRDGEKRDEAFRMVARIKRDAFAAANADGLKPARHPCDLGLETGIVQFGILKRDGWAVRPLRGVCRDDAVDPVVLHPEPSPRRFRRPRQRTSQCGPTESLRSSQAR